MTSKALAVLGTVLVALVALLAGSFAAAAEPPKGPRIATYQTCQDGLRDLGYVEGVNLILDVRWADGNADRVPALVDDVLALKPDVLVGWERVAQVMRTKTSVIPIVLTGEPIR